MYLYAQISIDVYATIPLGSVRLVYSRTSLPAMLIAVVVGKLKRRALTTPAKQICRRSLIRQRNQNLKNSKRGMCAETTHIV